MAGSKVKVATESVRITLADDTAYSVVAVRTPAGPGTEEGWFFQAPLGSGLEHRRIIATTAAERDETAEKLLLAMRARDEKQTGAAQAFQSAVDEIAPMPAAPTP